MLELDQRYGTLEDPLIEQLAVHADEMQLVYRRGPLVFVFNFHPTESYQGLRIPVPEAKDYRLLVNTDGKAFEGHQLVEADMVYPWQNVSMYGQNQTIQLYLPSRTAQVLAPIGASEQQ